MNSKVEAIFLDIGGVILEIDWRRPLQAMRVGPLDQLRIVAQFANWQPHYDYECGLTDDAAFVRELKKLAKFDGPDGEVKKAWESLILGQLPGIESVFKKYKGRAPIVALSNTNRIHYDYFMAHAPVMKEFDDLYTSFDFGRRKPERDFYLEAADKIGVRPERCLFIDDTAENVEGALACGFHAHQSVNSAATTMAILERYF